MVLLSPLSPVINKGLNSAVTNINISTDITGAPRIQNENVNIGAYEVTQIAPCKAANRLYVNAGGDDSGDGTSWDKAFKTLQKALDCIDSGESIWVAKGTYFPTKDPFGSTSPVDARDKTFYIPDGVKIYGGFNGTESTLAERILATENTTTLSGDLGMKDDNSDNSYHVVLAVGSQDTGIGVTIDGCTITGGNANNAGSITVKENKIYNNGGGGIRMFNGSNTLNNNMLLNNLADYGGGVYIENGVNKLNNNIISENSANTSSGGVIIVNGNNTLTNNILTANSAEEDGGGIYMSFGTNTLANNILSRNSADGNGGGIYLNFGTHMLINNTLSKNSAKNAAGGIYTNNSTNTLSNNIFWDNKKDTETTVVGADYRYINSSNTFKNNLLQLEIDSYTSANNTDLGADASDNIFAQDPLFVDAKDLEGSDGIPHTADDGLSLSACSPAVNAGTDLEEVTATDITGAVRVNDGAVDVGAYENYKTTTTTVTTTAASAITSTSATLAGTVTANCEGTITERGIVYSATNANPQIDGTEVTKDPNNVETGTFFKIYYWFNSRNSILF